MPDGAPGGPLGTISTGISGCRHDDEQPAREDGGRGGGGLVRAAAQRRAATDALRRKHPMWRVKHRGPSWRVAEARIAQTPSCAERAYVGTAISLVRSRAPHAPVEPRAGAGVRFGMTWLCTHMAVTYYAGRPARSAEV